MKVERINEGFEGTLAEDVPHAQQIEKLGEKADNMYLLYLAQSLVCGKADFASEQGVEFVYMDFQYVLLSVIDFCDKSAFFANAASPAEMAQLLSKALINTNFTALVSPYQSNNETLHGILNASHTSNVAAVYRSTTITTPWPYLTAGMGISILVALVHLISGSLSSENKIHRFLTRTWDRIKLLFRRPKIKKPREPSVTWRPLARFLNIGAMIVITNRAVPTFVASVQVLQDKGGRYYSVSAVLTQTLSIIPYMYDTGSPTYWFEVLAAINCLLCVSSLVMMTYANAAMGVSTKHVRGSGYYGEVYLTGGTCPRSVGTCDGGLWVGCDDTSGSGDTTQRSPGTNATTRADVTSSTNMAGVDGFAAYILLILFIGLLCTINRKLLSKATFLKIKKAVVSRIKVIKEGGILGIKPHNVHTLTREYNETHRKPFGKELSPAEFCEKRAHDQREATIHWYYWYLFLMLLLAAITIPMHYNLQTEPASLIVADSRGPWLEASKNYDANKTEVWSEEYFSSNGTLSWSDCFEVTLVSDKYGFFEAWWEDVRDKPAKWLALL